MHKFSMCVLKEQDSGTMLMKVLTTFKLLLQGLRHLQLKIPLLQLQVSILWNVAHGNQSFLGPIRQHAAQVPLTNPDGVPRNLSTSGLLPTPPPTQEIEKNDIHIRNASQAHGKSFK